MLNPTVSITLGPDTIISAPYLSNVDSMLGISCLREQVATLLAAFLELGSARQYEPFKPGDIMTSATMTEAGSMVHIVVSVAQGHIKGLVRRGDPARVLTQVLKQAVLQARLFSWEDGRNHLSVIVRTGRRHVQ